MGGARKFSVLLLALACAAALAACGGGDSSTATTAGGTAQGTTGTTTAGGTEGAGGSQESQGGKGGGNKPASQGGGSGGGSGSSGERSAGFRTPGGDNSIQEYGGEAAADERAKATQTIAGFFSASEKNEWGKVCALLSADNLSSIEQLGEKVPKLKGKGCASVLALITAQAPGKSPEAIKGAVVSLRTKGNVGFALYHGANGKNYAFPLKLEEGVWKLTGLAPTPLSF